ncbi:MAG: TolC family protein [Steroidobacteraceae bacterium]|jgi:NodT family efflux transporter outer membrane factor (OMF) lipoprotein
MSKVWLALTVLLAGCATQVPQAMPPRLMPGAFTGPVPSGAQLWPDASWWRGFGDAQLVALVEQAQADNRDLAIAAARVMQAEAQSTIQRAALLPQISGGTNYQAGGCRGLSCQQYPSGRAFGLQVTASYALDFWGLARDNLRAANEQLKAARFAQQSVALTVTANVASQYLTVLSLRRRIAIANEYIAAINSILDVIKLRVKAGATSHLDLAQEQAQIEAVQAQLPSLETLEKQALYSLAVLLGRPPEGFDVPPAELDAVLAPPVGTGLPSDLLLRRPDVAQAEATLASAHANVDAARAAFLPQISLTGSGGFVSSAIGTLLQVSSSGYSYGVGLLQTIFDGGKLIGGKRLAEATQAQDIAAYQSAALNAYADAEFSLVEVANSGRAEKHLRSLIGAAQEAFEISQLQYRQGVADLIIVLQAQGTLFSAEDQLAQTVLANRLASIDLYEALGGGWVEKPEERTQFAQIVSVQLTSP